MEEPYYRIAYWLRDYFLGRLSSSDQEKLMEWVNSSAARRSFFEHLKKGEVRGRKQFFHEIDLDKAFQRFEKRIGRKIIPWTKWMVYAASFFLPLFVALTLYLKQQQPEPVRPTVQPVITPGSYKAILTLANGESVVLDKDRQTNISLSSQSRIESNGDKIIYDVAADRDIVPEYNYLATPRGGEYQLILADGTRVYLNADTKLKYPVAFTGDKREVTLFGEAYFEVATDSCRPFYVITEATRIRVYGTVFNVNTHLKEKVQTVLVSGKIGITGKATDKEYLMQPAELSEFSATGNFIGIRKVDPAQYAAWHFGRFCFENQRLEDILEQLALWYDVEVFYTRPALKEQYFTGNVKRYEQIEVILDAIRQITGVKFVVRGKTITVTE